MSKIRLLFLLCYNQKVKILGIETSCDETAAAVVEDGTKILSNEIASQVEIHARYGGIVPEVASRQHTLSIIPIIKSAMGKARIGWQDLGAIAVTNGPGLAGSLLTGVNTAKAISLAHNLPLIGVNHLEGHIYANWLNGPIPEFPLVCLIVSGGHSDLVLMKRHGDYTLLGRTRDDAAGEAFDKAARLLDLGYPGGPAIQKAAVGGKTNIPLPKSWIKGTNDFSFSGIKSSLLRLVTEIKPLIRPMPPPVFSRPSSKCWSPKPFPPSRNMMPGRFYSPVAWPLTSTSGKHWYPARCCQSSSLHSSSAPIMPR